MKLIFKPKEHYSLLADEIVERAAASLELRDYLIADIDSFTLFERRWVHAVLVAHENDFANDDKVLFYRELAHLNSYEPRTYKDKVTLILFLRDFFSQLDDFDKMKASIQ